MVIPEFFSRPAALLLLLFVTYIIYRLAVHVKHEHFSNAPDECDYGYAEPDSTFYEQDLNEWGHDRDEVRGRGRR